MWERFSKWELAETVMNKYHFHLFIKSIKSPLYKQFTLGFIALIMISLYYAFHGIVVKLNMKQYLFQRVT